MFPLFITSNMRVKPGNNSSGTSQSNGTIHNSSGTAHRNSDTTQQ